MANIFVNLSALSNGTGSELDPYNTFASVTSLSPGDTVKIKGEGQLAATWDVPASGTSGVPITIEAWEPDRPPLIGAVNGAVSIRCQSRSYVVHRLLKVLGDPAWTSQNTHGFSVSGAGTDVTYDRCEAEYCGIGFAVSTGFSRSGIYWLDCVSRYHRADGLRAFSPVSDDPTYTLERVHVIGGDYSYNGRGGLFNGSGILYQILLGRNNGAWRDFLVDNVRAVGNRTGGVYIVDNGEDWTALTDPANTTPPARRLEGVEITRVVAEENGVVGIYLKGARPGAARGVRITRNRLLRNSRGSTLGNIWTGANKDLVIAENVCEEAYSNGTSVGDGVGIFDDQWNDGTVVARNRISRNVYQSFNPEYTASGIAIYRAINCLHYANVIEDCRHGYYIGTVTGASTPDMSNVRVLRNTIRNVTRYGVYYTTALQSSKVTLRGNLIDGAERAMHAGSTAAGSQIFSDNYAARISTNTMTNVPESAVTFRNDDPKIYAGGRVHNPDYWELCQPDQYSLVDFYGRAFAIKPTPGAIQNYYRGVFTSR